MHASCVYHLECQVRRRSDVAIGSWVRLCLAVILVGTHQCGGATVDSECCTYLRACLVEVN